MASQLKILILSGLLLFAGSFNLQAADVPALPMGAAVPADDKAAEKADPKADPKAADKPAAKADDKAADKDKADAKPADGAEPAAETPELLVQGGLLGAISTSIDDVGKSSIWMTTCSKPGNCAPIAQPTSWKRWSTNAPHAPHGVSPGTSSPCLLSGSHRLRF